MSKHRDILPEVIKIVVKEYPHCGILLHGSVQRRCERPDSDLDLIVIHEGGDAMKSEHDWIHNGVEMCMTYIGKEWLADMLVKRPYWWWPLSQADILYDAKGVAQCCQAVAKQYFAERPDIADFWERQSRDYWHQKQVGKTADETGGLVELVRSLDERYGK